LQGQADLACWAEILAARGVPVLIAHPATPFTEPAYRRSEAKRVGVRWFIGCDGSHRSMGDEVLALFGGDGR